MREVNCQEGNPVCQKFTVQLAIFVAQYIILRLLYMIINECMYELKYYLENWSMVLFSDLK